VKVYGSGDTAVRALDGVTVGFARAQFTAIMGPSGSGKSTLMHCLAGLDTATSGRALLGGTDLTVQRQGAHPGAPRADRLRLPVVQPAAAADRRAEHHAAAGPGRPRADAACSPTSPTCSASRPAHHRPSELSGGQQQRVALARALVARPRWSSPTSRPATWTPAPAPRCCVPAQLGARTRPDDRHGHPRPGAAAYADRVVLLADGRLVDRMESPTADKVLDRLKAFEVPS
jgi:putative ABC transport system ATP-binding protein